MLATHHTEYPDKTGQFKLRSSTLPQLIIPSSQHHRQRDATWTPPASPYTSLDSLARDSAESLCFSQPSTPGSAWTPHSHASYTSTSPRSFDGGYYSKRPSLSLPTSATCSALDRIWSPAASSDSLPLAKQGGNIASHASSSSASCSSAAATSPADVPREVLSMNDPVSRTSSSPSYSRGMRRSFGCFDLPSLASTSASPAPQYSVAQSKQYASWPGLKPSTTLSQYNDSLLSETLRQQRHPTPQSIPTPVNILARVTLSIEGSKQEIHLPILPGWASVAMLRSFLEDAVPFPGLPPTYWRCRILFGSDVQRPLLDPNEPIKNFLALDPVSQDPSMTERTHLRIVVKTVPTKNKEARHSSLHVLNASQSLPSLALMRALRSAGSSRSVRYLRAETLNALLAVAQSGTSEVGNSPRGPGGRVLHKVSEQSEDEDTNVNPAVELEKVKSVQNPPLPLQSRSSFKAQASVPWPSWSRTERSTSLP